MALIDEYKQAIQDVLDGRAKDAPKPSELPWTEDKAATIWAAAAAELIAEGAIPDPELPSNPTENGTYVLTATKTDSGTAITWESGGGGVLVVTDTDGTLNKTWKEIHDAFLLGPVIIVEGDNILSVGNAGTDDVEYWIDQYVADSENGYPEKSK